MSAENLSMAAGALISFVFRFPGVNGWFDKRSAAGKQWVMLGVLLVTAAGIVLLACTGWATDFGLTVACDRPGLVMMINALIGAVMANQGVYQLTRKMGK